MIYWLIAIPFIAAFIGWMLARCATGFLFRPITQKSFFGIKVQGLLPARRAKLIVGISEYVANEFRGMSSLSDKFSDPESLKKVLPMIEEHMDDFLRNRLKKEMPVIGMFIGDKTIDALKKTFLDEIEKLLPAVINKYAANITSDIDIKSIIAGKLNSMSGETMERKIRLGLAPLFIGMQIAGAIIGFLSGVVQILLTMIAGAY